MSLLTSRRDFFKLFGGAVVTAVVPVPLSVIEALAPAGPAILPVAALPPNILHVLRRGVWEALGSITEFTVRPDIRRVIDRYGISQGMRSGPDRVDFDVFPTPQAYADLQGVLYGGVVEHYGITMSSAALEFDAQIYEITAAAPWDRVPRLSVGLVSVVDAVRYVF